MVAIPWERLDSKGVNKSLGFLFCIVSCAVSGKLSNKQLDFSLFLYNF